MPGDDVFAKGLEANGYKVTRYDYRDKQDKTILEVAKDINPDLIWFGKCETVSLDEIIELRKEFPKAIFVKWAADVRSEPVELDIKQAGLMDFFFGTFGGDYLKRYKSPNNIVASIVAFTDSDLFYPVEVEEKWKSDVLFTGRTNMIAEVNRTEYLSYLKSNNVNLKWYGQENWIQFPDYRLAINGAKIGLGLNHFIKPLYSSDRLGNYLACGTFYLSQYFPGIERVFNRYELDWFSTKEECLNKIWFYLKNEELREEMAQRARKIALEYFDYKPLVKNCLNIIETGRSNNEWDDVF